MANNKVKFNLWNVYYAPLLTNTTSKIEYGAPIAIPGAVSLSLDKTVAGLIQKKDLKSAYTACFQAFFLLLILCCVVYGEQLKC